MVDSAENLCEPEVRDSLIVFGASGLLGQYVCAELAQEFKVIRANRTANASEPFQVRVDITNTDEVSELIDRFHPAYVLNAAAIASHEQCLANPELAVAVNSQAPGHLAAICAERQIPFTHISTDAVFDGVLGNYRESDPVSPFSLYGETKTMGEAAVLRESEESLVIRTNFFGWTPTGKRSALEFFVGAMRERKAVIGYTDYITSSIYANHLAIALRELIKFRPKGILHLAASDSMSKYEFAMLVASEFNLERRYVAPLRAPRSIQGVSRNRNLSLDVARAEGLLGRKLPSQAEGLCLAREQEFRRSF